MPMYVKKPIPIEARQITNENADELAAWSGSDVVERPDGTISGMMVYTLEGTMTGAVGDYLIRGVRGEHYFCAKDIFEETYEEHVEEEECVLGPNDIELMNIQDMSDGSAWIDFNMGREALNKFASIGILKVLVDAANEVLDKEKDRDDDTD